MKLDWRFLLRVGLLAGVVILYTAVIGMVEVFSEREVLAGLVTLGQVLLFAPAIVAGYIAARRATNAVETAVYGAVAGFLSSLPPLLLVIVANAINLRAVFVNITPALLEILTFGQESTAVGGLFLLGALTLAGLIGSLATLVPERPRRILIFALIITLVAGMMSELLVQVFQQYVERDTLRIFFRSGVLTVAGAVIVFALAAIIYGFWYVKGEDVRARRDALPGPQQRRVRQGTSVAVGLILLALPWLLGVYLSEVMSNVGLYVLMGLGLNIAVGWAGLLDLGYVTNFAVGAYVMALLASTGPLGVDARAGIDIFNFWLVIPISILAAMLTGFLFALPVLRMRGDYLAIATLGFGEIIRLLAISDWLKPLIGGAQGVLFIPKPMLFGFEFGGPQQLYYLIFAACLFVLFVAVRLNNSRTGRQWMAMREDEDVAAAMGIDTVKTKLLAFTLSAASGGLAGAIFASKVGAIFPNSFGLLVSINVLSLIIVGGIGSIPGVVLGATVLIGLPELLREFAEFRLLLYGALLVIMMLVRPEGLWPSTVTQRELQGALDSDLDSERSGYTGGGRPDETPGERPVDDTERTAVQG